jgi:tRNA pseudouridine55 synthase
MGTLDPMACGLLPIAIGKATRLFDYSLNKVKRYNVVYEFGYITDTLDATGNIIQDNMQIPSKDSILKEIITFIGKSMQVPPKFSANHVNGRRAYDLAREGVEFELKPKEIEIFEFELLEKINEREYKFSILCSSGTYIRSIGRDLAEKLNSGATMTYLERCENGFFTIDNCVKLEDLLNGNIEDYLISPIDVFQNFDIININSNQCKDLLDGKKININVSNNSFILCDNNLIGISRQNGYLKLDTYLGD